MSYQMSKEELTEVVNLGVTKAMTRLGLVRDEISQREAYRLFGEAKVKLWTAKQMCKRIKINDRNSTVTYSLIELETLSTLENNKLLKV